MRPVESNWRLRAYTPVQVHVHPRRRKQREPLHRKERSIRYIRNQGQIWHVYHGVSDSPPCKTPRFLDLVCRVHHPSWVRLSESRRQVWRDHSGGPKYCIGRNGWRRRRSSVIEPRFPESVEEMMKSRRSQIPVTQSRPWSDEPGGGILCRNLEITRLHKSPTVNFSGTRFPVSGEDT